MKPIGGIATAHELYTPWDTLGYIVVRTRFDTRYATNAIGQLICHAGRATATPESLNDKPEL